MKRQRTFQWYYAMFIAIIILQSFVPFLGNPTVSDFRHDYSYMVIVVDCAGPQVGFLLGFTWGCVHPSAPYFREPD